MKKLFIIMVVVLFAGSTASYAAMSNFLTYTEEGAGISIDAVGLNDNTLGTIQADIPAGAQIYAAYFYSAAVGYSGNNLYNVDFNGTVYNSPSRLDVGAKDGNNWVAENRWDVTSQVQTVVGSGNGIFNFTVQELGYLDGEILAVVYKVAGNPVNTAFIFDGELSTTGDSFNVNLTTPYQTGDPAIMSLGISYSYESSSQQYSIVDINGNRLTTSAGGEDDGYSENGGLITAGGIGDSISNPANPNSLPDFDWRYDDELYNIGSLLSNGATLITINTLNPSNDDNVFFMGLTVKGEATTPQVPEPGTMMLLGSVLMGMVGYKKVRSSN